MIGKVGILLEIDPGHIRHQLADLFRTLTHRSDSEGQKGERDDRIRHA